MNFARDWKKGVNNNNVVSVHSCIGKSESQKVSMQKRGGRCHAQRPLHSVPSAGPDQLASTCLARLGMLAFQALGA